MVHGSVPLANVGLGFPTGLLALLFQLYGRPQHLRHELCTTTHRHDTSSYSCSLPPNNDLQTSETTVQSLDHSLARYLVFACLGDPDEVFRRRPAVVSDTVAIEGIIVLEGGELTTYTRTSCNAYCSRTTHSYINYYDVILHIRSQLQRPFYF